MKLGSLFDGAGTFPFAAKQYGIKPCWASEIESYPIVVTSKRFPNMRHLGDITKINGAEIEPVDIITFGSPCQDLSVAGKREGLKGERSGLFEEAIRIIKEMRGKTNGKYPTFAVWENVPGAFSSNGGEDFRTVLEMFCQIKAPTVYVPRPYGGGATENGNTQVVSWATGIPSLGAYSMRDIGEYPNVAEESFLWQILEVNVPQKYYLSAKACAGVLRRAERRGKELPTILKKALEQQIERWEKYGTPLPYQGNIVNFGLYDTMGTHTEGIAPTITAGYSHQLGDNVAVCVGNVCYDARGNGDGKTVPTITGDHNNRLTDYTAVVCETYAGNSSGNNIAGTIDSHYYLGCGARGGKEREFVAIAVDRSAFNQGENAKYNIGIDEKGTAFTVTAKGPGAVCYCLQGNGVDRADTAGCNGKGVKENECYTLNTVDRHAVCYGFSPDNSPSCDGVNLNEELSPTLQVHKKLGICRETAETQYIVRRLTPLECCRLQGMPDWWVNGVDGSDAAKYKMWGNGMALPCALYVMEGIAIALRKQFLEELNALHI